MCGSPSSTSGDALRGSLRGLRGPAPVISNRPLVSLPYHWPRPSAWQCRQSQFGMRQGAPRLCLSGLVGPLCWMPWRGLGESSRRCGRNSRYDTRLNGEPTTSTRSGQMRACIRSIGIIINYSNSPSRLLGRVALESLVAIMEIQAQASVSPSPALH